MRATDAGNPAITALVIVSEVRFVRDSLREIFGRQETLRVEGAFPDFAGAATAMANDPPDMVLLDASLRDWISAVARLREAAPHVLVVAFALSESVEAVLAWAEAGIDGYIPSSAAAADLCNLIEDIRAGRQACSGQVAAGLLHRIATATRPARTAAIDARVLTPREFEIVNLVSQGFSNKDIARHLEIGVSTAKSHVHNALLKLQLERRGQLASLMRSRPPEPLPP